MASGAGLGACLVSLCCAPVFGQSLGDVARQERQRKEQQASRSLHVYTNDDLRKSKILVPEDQARALAARNLNNQMPVPVELAAVPNAIAPLQFLLPASTSDTDIKDPSSWEPEPAEMGISRALVVDSTGVEGGPAAADVAQQREAVQHRSVARNSDPFAPQKVARHIPPAAVEPKHVAAVASHATASPVVAVERAHAMVEAVHATVEDVHATVGTIHTTRKAITANFAHAQDATSSKDGKVVVQRGDSLWKLAQRYLGDGNRWFDLAEMNPQLESPNLIRVGDWIRVHASEAEGTKQVVVRSGDTLWSVAQTELGTARGVECIVEANPQLESSDLIRPGQKLFLPRNCSVTR